jgi:hypothetical protein
MSSCVFDIGWVGRCKDTTVDGTDYCAKHTLMKCVVCSRQATHDCPEALQFVCGAPLCGVHYHVGGWNSYGHGGPRVDKPEPVKVEKKVEEPKMSDIKITKTSTAEISGTGDLTGDALRNFANSIPTTAKITLQKRESNYRPGDYGPTTYTPWKLTATWTED